jgi:hypothetical protein
MCDNIRNDDYSNSNGRDITKEEFVSHEIWDAVPKVNIEELRKESIEILLENIKKLEKDKEDLKAVVVYLEKKIELLCR